MSRTRIWMGACSLTYTNMCLVSSANQMASGSYAVWRVLQPACTLCLGFQHHDLLVPWKLKPAAKTEPDQKREEESYLEKGSHEVPTFYRYYHVFDEGELEQLCSSVKGAKVVQSYYDQGNWCVTLERA